MNHLLNLSTLKNQYYVMRHGQSLANVEGLIVSTPENGVPNYGLSDAGRNQVTQSIRNEKLKNSVKIISSDFKRAHESAKIAHKLIACNNDITLDIRLRERDFGDFELQPDRNYQTPWTHDAVDSSHTIDNVESADSVMERATSLILLLEEEPNIETYLLVAHGDTLQILQTAFLKQPATKQREMPHLNTAEIRALKLASSV